MAFGKVGNFGAWGVALAGSLALHVVALGLVFGSRGCGSTPPPLQPAPVPQTDGRATDLPEASPTPAASADEPKMAETPTKPAPKKSVGQKKPENRKPEAKKPAPKKPEGKSAAADDAPAAEPTEGWKTYKVKPGDSLTRIARSCGLTVPELAKANGLSPTANLRLGQSLKIKDVPADGE